MQVIFCRGESTSHLQLGVDLWTQPFRWKNQTDCILHTDCIFVLERVRGAYHLVGREMSVSNEVMSAIARDAKPHGRSHDTEFGRTPLHIELASRREHRQTVNAQRQPPSMSLVTGEKSNFQFILRLLNTNVRTYHHRRHHRHVEFCRSRACDEILVTRKGNIRDNGKNGD